MTEMQAAEASEQLQSLAVWTSAEAAHAASLARAAAALAILGERLRHGPAGWQSRLACREASDLSWWSGTRIGADRLGIWLSLHQSTGGDDIRALHQTAWAARRLSGGAGPEAGLSAFLDRRDGRHDDPLSSRAEVWAETMSRAGALHPITRACMGFHLWSMAGLAFEGAGRIEAAVAAARMAATESGAVFAPLSMGQGLQIRGAASSRLSAWLEGIMLGCRAAMRHLDDLRAWEGRARHAARGMKGRTPSVLIEAMLEWPMLSAPMAEELTAASRATVQRNLAWMEQAGLIRELTGQGRYRLWKATV